jgi:hypothetical protein
MLALGLEACAGPNHEVLRQNEVLFHAIADRDIATLERLTAPEFHFETAEGVKGERANWLEGVRAMPYVIESIRNDDVTRGPRPSRAVRCAESQSPG